MQTWQRQLRFDPIPPLLSVNDEALRFFVKRDLLEEEEEPIDRLWRMPGALKILKKQQADGSWIRHGERKDTAINYHLIECEGRE
jgi:hypothetical protein